MKGLDIAMVVSVLLAPLLAVQVQKRLEELRERRTRKLEIFKTLMATRGYRLSPAHVQALNSIDIEFRKDKTVTEAWRIYLDHLNDVPHSPQHLEPWAKRGETLFIDVLMAMSKSLGYEFDRVLLLRGIYTPKRHYDDETFSLETRNYIINLMRGEASLPIEIKIAQTSPEVQEALLDHLTGKTAVRVSIERSRV